MKKYRLEIAIVIIIIPLVTYWGYTFSSVFSKFIN